MLTIRITALALAFALTDGAAVAAPSAAQIITLIKASPQLEIDTSVHSPGFDSKTQPYVRLRGLPEGESIGGHVLAQFAHEGTLRDGGVVLVVPLDSGGSGGVFTQIVFAGKGSQKFAYAGRIDSGGHLGVWIDGGVIVARMPHYGANDPQCCPLKYLVQTFTVRRGRLSKLSERFTTGKK